MRSSSSRDLACRATRIWGETVQHLVRVREDPTRPNRRQVHLIHGELHDELKQQGFTLGPGDIGENITTRGIDLLSLPHRNAAARSVAMPWWSSPACARRASRSSASVRDCSPRFRRTQNGNLFFRSGVMGIVLKDGAVRPGDTIRVELPPEPHQKLGKV